MKDEIIIICMKVGPGFRIPGSQVKFCSKCKEAVNVSPATLTVKDAEYVCVYCADIKDFDKVVITSEQIKEIKDAISKETK